MKLTLWLLLTISLFGNGAFAQVTPSGDPFAGLSFLEGRWSAQTTSAAGAPTVVGSYTFRKELGGHVLTRLSSSSSCKAAQDFDCEHSYLLYIFVEGSTHELKAIYLDNEGHVIHYSVSMPTPDRAVFLSDPSVPGPQFRLTYELRDKVMSGKFQMHMPGDGDWKSYLEWSGGKK